ASGASAVGRAGLVERPCLALAREWFVEGPVDAAPVYRLELVATRISPGSSGAALHFETAPCALGRYFPRSSSLFGNPLYRPRAARLPALGDAHRLSVRRQVHTHGSSRGRNLAADDSVQGRVHPGRQQRANRFRIVRERRRKEKRNKDDRRVRYYRRRTRSRAG